MTAGLSDDDARLLGLPLLLWFVLPGCIVDKFLHVHRDLQGNRDNSTLLTVPAEQGHACSFRNQVRAQTHCITHDAQVSGLCLELLPCRWYSHERLESERMKRHLVVCRDIPGLPFCHLWDEAELILALHYELLQLHGELLLNLLITGLRIHCLQPAC